MKSNGIWILATKLRIDFASGSRLREVMDQDDAELIARLCTKVGMIMEDASVIALTIDVHGDVNGSERVLDELVAVAQRILALVEAAIVVRG